MPWEGFSMDDEKQPVLDTTKYQTESTDALDARSQKNATESTDVLVAHSPKDTIESTEALVDLNQIDTIESTESLTINDSKGATQKSIELNEGSITSDTNLTESIISNGEQVKEKPSKFKSWLEGYYAKREAAGKPLTVFQKLKIKQDKKRALEDAETDPKKIKRIKAKRETFQAIKYFIIAGSAGVIQVGTYALFHDAMKWVPWLAHLVSLVLSVLWNFTFNRKYTFKSAVNVPKAMVKVALYYAVFTPLSMFWTGAFTTGIWGVEGLGVHPWAIEVPTLLINGVTEYLYQKFFVFNDAKEKEKAAKKHQEKEN